MAKKKALVGKGIRALLSNIDEEAKENPKEVVTQLSNSTAELPLSQIEVNPYQPRVEFDADALEELSTSIQVHGLIQPITVRRLAEGKYQLISGERRMRASKLAGLTQVPAYIRLANDQEMLEMALVENIQREQLNSIEIAITYQRLIDECNLTHANMSDRVGKNRSTVTNYLRLLKLPPEIQMGIKENKISMGHARALVGVDDIALQLTIFTEVVEKGLSVRKTEDLIRQYIAPQATAKKAAKPALPMAYQSVQENLRKYLGAKVQLKVNNAGKGQILINFGDNDDLNRLLDLIDQD